MKIASLVFIILAVSVGFSQFSQNVSQQPSANANSFKNLTIEDIKFDYDKKVFSDVKSSIIPAKPLENKDDKPDYVQSRNVHFQLTYVNTKKSFGEISVYDVNEYKDAFSLVPSYVNDREKSFNELADLINKNAKINPSGSKELPFVPYVDAHQEFYSKAKIIKFQNGKGLLFLTQINQDFMIINNERLTYIFQGLSDDKRYFIYAEFPVSAKGLPESDVDSFENYQIPESFYGDNFEKNKKKHDKYRNKIARRLENLKDEDFSPKLSKIESLLSSIKIKS